MDERRGGRKLFYISLIFLFCQMVLDLLNDRNAVHVYFNQFARDIKRRIPETDPNATK